MPACTARRSRRGEQQLATLNDLTGTLTTVLDPPTVAEAILKAVQVLLSGARRAALGMPGREDPGTDHHRRRGTFPGQTRLDIGVGLVGLAAAAREVAYSADVRTDPRFVNQTWAAAEGLVSAIALPLVQGDRVTGGPGGPHPGCPQLQRGRDRPPARIRRARRHRPRECPRFTRRCCAGTAISKSSSPRHARSCPVWISPRCLNGLSTEPQ
ncbi:MAG: GAF domain-containing protein [Ignavibacteriales bacterium]|nr:GAF domain-containing protein [Ignavibacteriales bacterium]